MTKKLPSAIRGLLSTAFLLLVAGLLNTTPVQSAPTAGTLIIVNDLIKDNGGNANFSDFEFSINNGVDWIPFDVDGQNDLLVDNGTYDVIGKSVTGYTTSYTDCSGVEILDNEATCTITNDDIAPKLTLIKDPTNDNGGDALPDDFLLTIGGVPATSGVEYELNANTEYIINETLVAGYSFDSITGDAKCPSSPGGSITLAEGDDITCTIVNDDDIPSLTLSKNVITDNGGTAVATDWTLTATGPTPISGPGGATSDGSFSAGTYTLSETGGPAGYEASDWVCVGGIQAGSQITIALGETVSCSITNDDFARLTVVKDPTNLDGGNALPDDFSLTVNGLPVVSGVATEYHIVNDNPLAINETLLVGYEFVEITDDGSGKCPAVLGETFSLALGDDITCTIVNDDVPAIKAVPAGGLVTDENGTKDVFTVVLTTIPSDPVSISVSSSLPTEATADPIELTFLPGNWDTPQPVTVTGVGDMTIDGDKPYNIILDPSTSAATEYAGLTPVQVSGTNFDTDSAGYIITPSTDLLTTEGGVTQKVEISLRSRPTEPVTLSIVSDDLTEGTVSTSSILIDPITWPQDAKEFTITGVDDCLDDGDVEYGIVITATSLDSNYTGALDTLTVTNHDAPTIQWVSPVGDGELYYIDGLGPIQLEVESICPEPISKVRFYRYVEPPIDDFVTIGEDLTPPYQEIIYPSELEFEWNEVRAFAFSPPPTLPGDIQTYSPYPYIFIYKGYGDERVFLPVVSR